MAQDHAFGLPSFEVTAVQVDKEILASYSPSPRIEGITVLGGTAVIPSGSIMGRVTASGKYVVCLNTPTDGSENGVGVLRSMVDASGSGDRPGELITEGSLKYDQIEEPTNGAIADVIAEAITNGVGPFQFATFDTVRNVLDIG
jgi:hypothetical protein